MNLSDSELREIGIRDFGEQVRIDSSVRLFNPGNISIGDNVRIDCFCLLSAGADGIKIGSHIHIGAGVYLYGTGGRILLEDYAGISPRVTLFTASDDFTDGFLHGPIVSEHLRNVKCGPIQLARNSVVGSGSVILPGVTIGQNAAVGALCVVAESVPDNHVAVSSGRALKLFHSRDEELSERLMQEFYVAWSERRT